MSDENNHILRILMMNTRNMGIYFRWFGEKQGLPVRLTGRVVKGLSLNPSCGCCVQQSFLSPVSAFFKPFGHSAWLNGLKAEYPVAQNSAFFSHF